MLKLFFKSVVTLGLVAISFEAQADNPELNLKKNSIIKPIQEFIAKKEKKFGSTYFPTDFKIEKICKESKAISCHVFRLNNTKRKKRAIDIMTMFSEGCLAKNGQFKKGKEYPAGPYGYFQYNHKLKGEIKNHSGTSYSNRVLHLGCWLNNNPELFMRINSVEPITASNDGIGKLTGKTNLYVLLYDANALKGDFEKIISDAAKNDIARAARSKNYDICMSRKPQVGEYSGQGLVVEIKGAVTQVQKNNNLVWVKSDSLKMSINECR